MKNMSKCLLCSSFRLAEDTSNSLQPDVNFINTFLKPEKLTRVEKRFKGRAVMEMMKLDKAIKETRTRLEPLVVETRQLLEEKDHVQKENQFFQEYLTKQTEESRQRTEKLWNYYLQQSMKIEQRKQELTSKYAMMYTCSPIYNYINTQSAGKAEERAPTA